MAKKILLYIGDENLYYELVSDWKSNIKTFKTFNSYLNFRLKNSK